MIYIDTSNFDLLKARKIIDKFLARRVSTISSGIYNNILTNTKPKWSGQYLASWSISIGSPDYTYLPNPTRVGDKGYPSIHYPKNGQQTLLVPNDNPYQRVYITNASDHAMQVEYNGTPTHPGEGWMIATNALNTAVSSFRFF